MIFGLNFNNTPIPDGIKRKFKHRLALPKPASWAMLQGVCNSKVERDAMLVVAQNGNRKLYVEERTIKTKCATATVAETWYGIYVA